MSESAPAEMPLTKLDTADLLPLTETPTLIQAAASADQAFPDNHALTISEKGEPSLRKIRAKVRPRGMKRLEAALHARPPERHLLDILCRVDH